MKKQSKKQTPKSVTNVVTKSEQVKKHLLSKKSITSWEAISLYKATRLSAIIFNLRNIGWDIVTNEVTQKDINGNNCTFAKYILVKPPVKK
jgi:hypothetical protein